MASTDKIIRQLDDIHLELVKKFAEVNEKLDELVEKKPSKAEIEVRRRLN